MNRNATEFGVAVAKATEQKNPNFPCNHYGNFAISMNARSCTLSKLLVNFESSGNEYA